MSLAQPHYRIEPELSRIIEIPATDAEGNSLGPCINPVPMASAMANSVSVIAAAPVVSGTVDDFGMQSFSFDMTQAQAQALHSNVAVVSADFTAAPAVPLAAASSSSSSSVAAAGFFDFVDAVPSHSSAPLVTQPVAAAVSAAATPLELWQAARQRELATRRAAATTAQQHNRAKGMQELESFYQNRQTKLQAVKTSNRCGSCLQMCMRA